MTGHLSDDFTHTSSKSVLYWLEWVTGLAGLAAISGRDWVDLNRKTQFLNSHRATNDIVYPIVKMLVCKINFLYQELIACILKYFRGHDHGNVCVMPCAGCIIARARYAHAIWITNVPHTQADALVSQSTVYKC